MPVSFVRTHTYGASTSTATNISATLAADVAAGNLLVAWVGSRDPGTGVFSMSKPAGETAAWQLNNAFISPQNISGELVFIKTTVVWPAGTTVRAQFAGTTGNNDRRAIVLGEFTGADATPRGPFGSGQASGTTQPVASAASPDPQNGDLVLGGSVMAAADFWDSIDPDTDTVNGPWQIVDSNGLRTDFGDSHGLDIELVYKIPTANGAQTYDARQSNTHGVYSLTKHIGAVVLVLKATNSPPNAPTLNSPASGQVINRNTTQRLRWTFSDPNPNDTQSAADVRYRVVGSSTWTTVAVPSPNQFLDVGAGSFTAADYEWQVRTYDALGVVGPYSSSGFFTAGDPPAGPTITDPVNGSTVTLSQATLTWSTAQQDSYQVRKLPDDGAGNPDTAATPYYDSGEVVAATTRSVLLDFPINDRTEHLQVRVKYDSLWSDWVDVSVDVSYTPPATPVVSLSVDAATASLLIQVTNPDPGAGEPAAVYNEIWVDDGDGEERKANGVSPNGEWRYWTPRSLRDYSTAVRVVAIGSNGTTSSSL